MSGAATTQITGARTAASLRREERRGFSILGMSPATHIVLIGLACLIWWIARGMVNQTVTVENAAEVQFTLDDRLKSQWSIVTPKTVPTVSVDLSGPSAEVAAYASNLQANRGVFRYVYTIKPSDVERLAADTNEQAVIERELSDFREEGDSLKQAEVRILPPAAGRMQSVKLERVITRDAQIVIKDRISGEIPGYTMRVSVQDGFLLEVNGPAGRVREISGEDGRPALRIVVVDVAQLVANKAKVDAKDREQVLRDGFTENLDLVTLEGVSIQRKGTDTVVSQVPIRFSFEAQRDFTDTPAKDFPVSVIMAPWMLEKGVRFEGVARTVNVLMLVLRKQLQDFNDSNVSVVLDLSKLQFTDLKNIEQPEGGGPGPRRARLTGLYYSLVINIDKLTYKFKRDDVTARQYVPAEEIRLVWTE
jgi:hypothetical protein